MAPLLMCLEKFMMTISNKILEAREKRYHKILILQENYQTLVSLKVNYPGKDKNNALVYLILNALKLDTLPFSYEMMEKFISDDGPYYLFASNENASVIKDKGIEFEETHPLGRFLDIDVYNEMGPLSRKNKRKCYICNEPSHECVRSMKHSYEELYGHMERKTINYYENNLYQYIDDAIMIELNLDPKFGLVTRKTSGSHDDMNYELMLKAKKAIVPYFIDMFKLSVKIKGFEDHIDDLRALGIQAEIAMYEATNHVNAYKGLIFHLGLIISVYGYYISRNHDESFTNLIKDTADLFFASSDKNYASFGKLAFQEYQIRGAKGEALLAYPHVKEALNIYKEESDALKTLVYFICHIEDTNLLKRSKNLDFYKKVKNKFCNLNVNDQNKVNQLSQYCIDNHLSFGGSADLLIVTIFIKKLMENHGNLAFI